jgi:hypothetical protein
MISGGPILFARGLSERSLGQILPCHDSVFLGVSSRLPFPAISQANSISGAKPLSLIHQTEINICEVTEEQVKAFRTLATTPRRTRLDDGTQDAKSVPSFHF